MTRCANAIALGIAGAVTACGDAAQPSREAPYDFAIQCPTAPGCQEAAGTIRLVFRWPSHALPVRVWVEPGSELHHATSQAIGLWQRVALYGEFRAVIVPDRDRADVLIRLGDPFSSGPTTGTSQVAVQNDCGSSTSFDVLTDTTALLPFVTTIEPRAGRSTRALHACFEAAVAHELGHALGLLLHSADEHDLMNGRPRLAELSARDRATFTQLYHSTPTVRLPSGR